MTGRQGDVDFMLAGGTLTSDGARPNADADLTNLMGRIAMRVTPAWSVGGSFLVVRNTVGDPGDERFAVSRTAIGPYSFSNGVGRNDSTANLVTAFASHQHGDWKGEIKVYENRGHNNLVDDANWGTLYSAYRMWGVRWKESLSPTEDRHTEVGVKWAASADTSVDVSLFQDDIRKRYVWSGFFAGAIATPASGTWSNDFPDYRIRGMELAVRHRIDAGWSVFGGLTTLDWSLENLP